MQHVQTTLDPLRRDQEGGKADFSRNHVGCSPDLCQDVSGNRILLSNRKAIGRVRLKRSIAGVVYVWKVGGGGFLERDEHV